MWISKISSLSIGLKLTKKITNPFNPDFFILLIVNSFETLPKNSAWSFISECFALSWYTFVALTNKKLLLLLQCRLNANLYPDYVKLIQLQK